ncbi:MAG TPA: ABC transporter permease [Opitutaceae bacterium]|jgi:predicted permease
MRHLLRQIARRPGFSIIAIVTLALAAGLNGWDFTFFNATILHPSPIPDPQQVVSLDRTKPTTATAPWSPGDFDDLRRSNTMLASIAAYSFSGSNFSAPGLPAVHLRSLSVSGDFFRVFNVPPLLGRAIGPGDDRVGGPAVAVASERFWRGHLAADPNAIGRTIRLDGNAVTLIGVMPQRFNHPFNWGTIDLYTPLVIDNWNYRANAWLNAIGRLKSGETLGLGQSLADTIALRMQHDHPQEDAAAGIHLTPWEFVRRGGALNQKISIFALAMSLAVLLVACANLAGLQLARATGRTREFGVRMALGASRARLVRQLLGENLLLSVAGGALGVIIAGWGTRWTASQISTDVFDPSVLAFDFTDAAGVMVLAILGGVAFGIAPALLAAKTDLNATLKRGGRGATEGGARHVARNLLIVVEFALSLMLLACAGYFTGGIRSYLNTQWGWHPNSLIVGTVTLPNTAAYSTDAACRQFTRKLKSDLGALPGVDDAAVSGGQPVSLIWQTHRVDVERSAPSVPGREPVAYENPVSPGFFATFGTKLIAGRDFNDFDREGSASVVIINEAMALRLAPNGNVLHRRIRYLDGDDTQWAEVVGVVENVKNGLDIFVPPQSAFQTYRPLAQVPLPMAHYLRLAVRVPSGAAGIGAEMRSAMARLDPDLPIVDLESADEGLHQDVVGIATFGKTLTGMAFFGVLLAMIGIYGVISNLVARRTPEIGIRIALGATPKQVLTLVMSNGIRLSLVGALIGVALSFATYRILGSIFPGMAPASLLLLLSITLTLVAAALAACWFPARRATKVDPMIALRAE